MIYKRGPKCIRMIPLNIFDYSKRNKVDLKITKYVNDCLGIMIELQLMMLRDDPDLSLECLLPRDYVNRRPQECRNLIDELYEMVSSAVMRDWIKPKYEYLLFSIIGYWEDMCEDTSEMLIPMPLDEQLLNEIKNEPRYIADDGVNTILEILQDFDSYYDICFFDHDFLPDNLSNMIRMYVIRPDIFQRFYPDVDLDDYLDLMPVDLREFYLEKNLENITSFSVSEDIEMAIVFEIYKTIQRFQKRVVDFEKRTEVEISNDICDAIASSLNAKYGLHVSREAPMGRALVALGETDLYIYKEDRDSTEDYAIVENKFIDNFLQQYKQLLGYLNHYFRFGITISINNKYPLADAMKKIVNSLESIDDKDFPITSINAIDSFPYVVKSNHIIPEDKTRQMPVYHMVFQLYDIERKRIAREARGK
jgi:hypothetical protein